MLLFNQVSQSARSDLTLVARGSRRSPACGSWPRVTELRAEVGPVDTALRAALTTRWGGCRSLLCQMENEPASSRESTAWGGAHSVLPYPEFIFSPSGCVPVFHYLPRTMNLSRAHRFCFLAWNSSARVETLYFYACLADMDSKGREDINYIWVISPPLIPFTLVEGF